MELLVDGIIFERFQFGGIKRVFNNLLIRICDMDPTLQIELFFKLPPLINYPKHPQMSYKFLGGIPLFRPRRVLYPLQDLILKYSLNETKNKIWLSTYFTRPTFPWEGNEIVWVHDMIYERSPGVLPYSSQVISRKKAALENADLIFSNSKTTAEDVVHFYPHLASRIHVNYLAHDAIFTKHETSEIDYLMYDPFLLYVGKRKFYKGFSTLFDAYSKWDYKDDIKLIVVGGKWERDEIELIKNNKLEENILLLESVNDDVLCDLYNQATAFIYPSLYEGFGIPLLEAMACGCPVIASKIPSTLEVAGDVPIYFEPGNPKSLLEALDFAIETDDREKIIADGLDKASQYSWDKSAEDFYKGIQSLFS